MTDEVNRGVLRENIVNSIVSSFTEAQLRRDILAFADDVFAEAKVRLEEMAKTARIDHYKDIFDARVERLRALGCPAYILKRLQTKKAEVISKVCALNLPDNRDPLIPVVSSQYLTIYSQLEMIDLNGIAGDTDLEASRIMNVLKKGLAQSDGRIFDGIYFILDVDDGANTDKLTSAEADERIRAKSRSPLTVEEIIAVLLQSTERPVSNLLAVGSRYDQDDKVPVFMFEDSKTLLKTCYYNITHPNSVTRSCAARI